MRSQDLARASCPAIVHDREDIVREIEVERELGVFDHGHRNVPLRCLLEMPAVRVPAEARGDGDGRPAQEQVRSGFVCGRREHDGAERVDRASERRGGHEAVYPAAGRRARPCPLDNGLFLRLADGLREGRLLLGHRCRAPSRSDLEDRLIGETTHVSHPGRSSVASRTSSSIASVSAARSNGERTGASRPFASSNDFTGNAMARTRSPA